MAGDAEPPETPEHYDEPEPYYDERDDAEEGFCSECGEPCAAVMRDFGIGSYEFWGARGCHTDWQPVSPCCEAEVVKEKPEPKEPTP